MKIRVNLKRSQERESFFIPFLLMLVGAALFFFAQSDFDEQKVNQGIQRAGVFFEFVKASVGNEPVRPTSNRPKRRPF